MKELKESLIDLPDTALLTVYDDENGHQEITVFESMDENGDVGELLKTIVVFEG